MSNTFASSASLPIVGGAGTVGYTVYDSDAQTLIARTTANVTELFTGSGYSIYQAEISVADNIQAGTVIWDDGSGNAVSVSFIIPLTALSPGINYTYSGALLTSENEIKRLYSTVGVELRLDDLSDSGQTSFMNELVSAASETVASYTLRFYNTEDLVNSQWVRRRATIIAAYYLSLRRGNGAQFAMEYQRVMEELERFLTSNYPIIPGVAIRRSSIPTVTKYKVDDRYRHRKLRVDREYSSKSYPGRYDYITHYGNDYF